MASQAQRGGLSRRHLSAASEREASARAHLPGRVKRLVCHLNEMDAAKHLDDAVGVVRPFRDLEVEFLDPMSVHVCL
jgi:hypothetical protein